MCVRPPHAARRGSVLFLLPWAVLSCAACVVCCQPRQTAAQKFWGGFRGRENRVSGLFFCVFFFLFIYFSGRASDKETPRITCVLGSGFSCAPAILAGVLGCVRLCARSACTPPFLFRVCGVCVRVWVSLSPLLSCGWAMECVCWCVRSVLGWCRALFGVVCAFRVCSTRRPWLPGTWSCAVLVARGLASLSCLVAPLWCAAPRLVRSLSVCRSSFPSLWRLPLQGAYSMLLHVNYGY